MNLYFWLKCRHDLEDDKFDNAAVSVRFVHLILELHPQLYSCVGSVDYVIDIHSPLLASRREGNEAQCSSIGVGCR